MIYEINEHGVRLKVYPPIRTEPTEKFYEVLKDPEDLKTIWSFLPLSFVETNGFIQKVTQ